MTQVNRFPDWAPADYHRVAPCELCKRPTRTSDLTGTWVVSAVVDAGFIGRSIGVERLVFTCRDCPVVGVPDN